MNRAWVEINLNNLRHNIDVIKGYLDKDTKIMAVVKANAYGHGMIEIAKYLNSLGIDNFAVATLEEGITLRNNNIKGNILILGYTDIANIDLVVKYDLIQTIVDYSYAKKLNELKLNIKTQLKVDTGMNRIGINCYDFEIIKEVYHMEHLNVLGIFSHLCVSDSKKHDDIEFTYTQLNKFYHMKNILENSNINVGIKHILSSYGIINYSSCQYDMVRLGLLMYGVYDSNLVNKKLDLKPVLSLKAKISMIKEVDSFSSIGYGRSYITDSKRKIATVTIGYADGIPRSLSNKGYVEVNNKLVPIVGNICMDQLMIDITDVDNIFVGDTVTFIGNLVTVNDISRYADTINYEILSRLGNRLNYIYKDVE